MNLCLIMEIKMDRDSWLQDYDGYLDQQYQKQDDEEREQHEADHAVDEYFSNKGKK